MKEQAKMKVFIKPGKRKWHKALKNSSVWKLRFSIQALFFFVVDFPALLQMEHTFFFFFIWLICIVPVSSKEPKPKITWLSALMSSRGNLIYLSQQWAAQPRCQFAFVMVSWEPSTMEGGKWGSADAHSHLHINRFWAFAQSRQTEPPSNHNCLEYFHTPS